MSDGLRWPRARNGGHVTPTPDNEAGRLTDSILMELCLDQHGKYKTETYNRAWSALYALLYETLGIGARETEEGRP
jgi:hypothetical protein